MKWWFGLFPILCACSVESDCTRTATCPITTSHDSTDAGDAGLPERDAGPKMVPLGPLGVDAHTTENDDVEDAGAEPEPQTVEDGPDASVSETTSFVDAAEPMPIEDAETVSSEEIADSGGVSVPEASASDECVSCDPNAICAGGLCQCKSGFSGDGTFCSWSISAVVAGGNHTCAIMGPGVVRCWGDANQGQLGYGNTEDIGDDEAASTAGNVNVGGTVVQLAAGYEHTCALLDTGAVRCWGSGASGRLGYRSVDNIGDDELPNTAGNVDIGGTVTQISAGYGFTCALLDTGAVRCWGSGRSGQLGYGNTDNIGDDESPSSAGNVNVGGTVIQLATGGNFTCALLDTGAVRCWGDGGGGQLGYGSTDNVGDNESPSSAGNVDVGGAVTQLAAGGNHVCAVLENGAVRCWGFGGFGRLGYGSTSSVGDDELPSSAGNVDIGGAVSALSAGDIHTCALLVGGAVRCWGNGNTGRLGYGNSQDIGDNESPSSSVDVDLGGTAVQITTGFAHSCALLETGVVRCWGTGSSGQLGYGYSEDVGDDETPSEIGNVPIF